VCVAAYAVRERRVHEVGPRPLGGKGEPARGGGTRTYLLEDLDRLLGL